MIALQPTYFNELLQLMNILICAPNNNGNGRTEEHITTQRMLRHKLAKA